jgi:(p)ppGpp synthase/HD superfamily hydrolase
MGPLAERASEFARRAHAGQEYGDGTFHDNHLARVVGVLEQFGESDERLIAAAWLHDTVEDTDVTIDQIKDVFGDDVADLVWRLTDETGGSRRERHAKTHMKIRERSEAVRVKLADRIANVEASIEQKSQLYGMYRKEHAAFREHLYHEGEWEEMWARLNGLLERRAR